MNSPIAATYPGDYVTSRARFRFAAARLGWTCSAQAIDGTGPTGEDLTIDAAISRGAGAERVLVVSSGLHGVEGPFGAAVQLAVMERWADRDGPPAGLRYVFLHALNPHACAARPACRRRQCRPEPEFPFVRRGIHGQPGWIQTFRCALEPQAAAGALGRLRAPVLGRDPAARAPGLEAGPGCRPVRLPPGRLFRRPRARGHAPALKDRLRDWVGPAETAVHLDFHTGLGHWGTYKLLLDAPATPEQRLRLDEWFGPHSYEEDNANGVAYLPRGSFGPWCVAQRLAADYTYLVAEFGTYGVVRDAGRPAGGKPGPSLGSSRTSKHGVGQSQLARAVLPGVARMAFAGVDPGAGPGRARRDRSGCHLAQPRVHGRSSRRVSRFENRHHAHPPIPRV